MQFRFAYSQVMNPCIYNFNRNRGSEIKMEKIKQEIMHMFHAWRILFGSLVKWIILSIVIGGVIGVIASVFANLIAWATDFRMGHMWMVYLLPFAGLMIVFLYHVIM